MLVEHIGKQLLSRAGINIPHGRLISSVEDVSGTYHEFGSSLHLKAQIPINGRAKAGAIRQVESLDDALSEALDLFGSTFEGHRVDHLLLEESVDIDQELFLAISTDPVLRGPTILFSAHGGIDIEDLHQRAPEQILQHGFDIRHGPDGDRLSSLLATSGLSRSIQASLIEVASQLFQLYREVDAELVEVNPLAVTRDGRLVALDSKVVVDPAAILRHPELTSLGVSPDSPAKTDLERRAHDDGFLYIEFDGDVGVIANGAGLTMATLDVIDQYGGAPANFLEIGGDSYTRARPALEVVLANPNVRSLLVNFCGAFARTDVMAQGVLDALDDIGPVVQVSWSIRGTGAVEAMAIVQDRTGARPYGLMDDAVREAVANAETSRIE